MNEYYMNGHKRFRLFRDRDSLCFRFAQVELRRRRMARKRRRGWA